MGSPVPPTSPPANGGPPATTGPPSQPPATNAPSPHPSPSGSGNLPATQPPHPPATNGQPSQPSTAPKPKSPYAEPRQIGGHTGVMDVDPSKVYAAADAMHRASDVFGTAMLNVSRALHGIDDMAGKDYGGEFFGALYDPVAQEIGIVWEKLVIALGGVCEGLTTTANNFITADWHSRVGLGPVVGTRPVPQFHDFKYLRPASASGSGYLDTASLSEQLLIDGSFGMLMKWFPRGHPNQLAQAAAHWKGAATAVQALSNEVNRILGTITIDSKAAGKRTITGQTVTDWQGQMQSFCTRIWGKAPWDGANSSDAPLHVLGKASLTLATQCENHRQATVQTREALKQRVGPEIFDLIAEVATKEGAVAIITALEALFDKGMLIDCIRIITTKYFQPLQMWHQAQGAGSLLKELQEASRRTPTLQAMEAQAESVGDRAMHDFNYPGLNTGDAPGKGSQGRPLPGATPYGIDLAGQEGQDDAHVIDKHVGKTDEQLTQRTQMENVTSSSFKNLDEAQHYVQSAIDSEKGRKLIDAMIKSHDNPVQGQNPKSGTEIDYNAGPDTITGRSLEVNGRPHDVHGVKVIIHYNKNLSPPFSVTTAYPIDP